MSLNDSHVNNVFAKRMNMWKSICWGIQVEGRYGYIRVLMQVILWYWVCKLKEDSENSSLEGGVYGGGKMWCEEKLT
jgi:hypothetical protein